MTKPGISFLNDNNNHGKYPRAPANIYYAIPYYHHFFVLYALIGSFACAWYSDYLSSTTTALLWTAYATFILALIIANPEICTERKKIDEQGKEVILRCPLVGFKSCEVALDLEGIKKGLYDAVNGRVDTRLHDGYRYGRALIRI
ncbi:hypothetical protein ASPWEDRAFT_38042 [Aspergillus wentii DTO 134E9]|uniref:Uncharacterized protein n=1 Tax=Aspergillus wentii DTO 134E9 TaxID=1073089 RepID=A0A1L9RNQ2_ASPWE|nr:uncharacterized protein ASPWEDRAFT_38042 [Aspergillus wentii DTO 134E9]KAI9926118.1 hypothetical protein MW887_004580 [Aspergillus wentii]OJJ36468.1 hypothetical protein ASPWEDRAFT_38042 [Aspergillus wentii DTO 134E9]